VREDGYHLREKMYHGVRCKVDQNSDIGVIIRSSEVAITGSANSTLSPGFSLRKLGNLKEISSELRIVRD
jgi:TATA-box binding protein (TBP) (component of TFIID and TFIIIB)